MIAQSTVDAGPPGADPLVARLASDLDAAFPEVVLALQDDVYSGVRRLVPVADAEDVTQETFVRAYRALGGYEAERIAALRLRGWIWTIALNLCRNRARSRGRKPATVPLEAGPDPASAERGPDATALDGVAEREWAERLGRLSPAMRTAVVLRHVVGLGYAEMADATGRPAGSLKSDVHRGLERLRRTIEREEAG